MSESSKIQWTDATWNIARGCTKVDSDCKFCYMYRDSFDGTRYNPRQITRTKTVFNLPLKLKEPSKIFTCSLTDFFHEAIDSYRDEAWEIIRQCPQHTFQILTKRPERIVANLPGYWKEIASRVWLGTSVGSMDGIQRIADLRSECLQCINFLSAEPLHEEISLNQCFATGKGLVVWGALFDWVIIGGESGHNQGLYRYRPCKLEWIERLILECATFHIPVFVKQLGTHLAKELKLKDRHGGDINEWPEHLRIREFPKPFNQFYNTIL